MFLVHCLLNVECDNNGAKRDNGDAAHHATFTRTSDSDWFPVVSQVGFQSVPACAFHVPIGVILTFSVLGRRPRCGNARAVENKESVCFDMVRRVMSCLRIVLWFCFVVCMCGDVSLQQRVMCTFVCVVCVRSVRCGLCACSIPTNFQFCHPPLLSTLCPLFLSTRLL